MLVMSESAIRCGAGPPNLAKFLNSLLHPPKPARVPVIVPKPVEFKLQTTSGFA